MLRLIGDKPQRILEVGCGGAKLSAPLAQAGHDVTGIDCSSAMLYFAARKARALPNLHIRKSFCQQHTPAAHRIVGNQPQSHLRQADQCLHGIFQLRLSQVQQLPRSFRPKHQHLFSGNGVPERISSVLQGNHRSAAVSVFHQHRNIFLSSHPVSKTQGAQKPYAQHR
ncbi:MAG: class I SAM-dependent methyltransferase [Clostridia bacterium]|nr:class I SAM-dependent methyltransferase [Clostridia bacterium]